MFFYMLQVLSGYIWCVLRPLTLHFGKSVTWQIVHGHLYETLSKSVLESPGKPVTGSPSILKGYHNALIDGSPSIIVSPVGKAMKVKCLVLSYL